MVEQTFLFCVGATKAGTSWLFEYLREHRDCHFPTVKELHYFDALEGGNGGWQRKQHQARLDDTRAALNAGATDNPYKQELVQDLEGWLEAFDGNTADDDAYLTYLKKGSGDAKVVGDFTPAYGLLSEGAFARMAGLGANVRFVYLLRDPVDRIWSNIRMVAGAGGAAALQAKIDGVLAGTATNILDRSNYRRTLNRLSRAVPAGNLHVEFYERLFTPEAIERLCGFLGITPAPASFDRVVHGSVRADLSADRRAQLQAALKPQYNFIEKFMGELPDEWTQKMVNA